MSKAFAPDDLVHNKSKPEWGPGKVVHVKGDIVHTYFRDRGVAEAVPMKASYLKDAKIDGDPELDDITFVEKNGRFHRPKGKAKTKAKRTKAKDIDESFVAFVETRVVPLREEHEDWDRLDGGETGTKPVVFGRFRHRGAVYRVRSDSWFEPLLIAYRAITDEETDEPFIDKQTKSGTRLDLRPNLAKRHKAPQRHLFISLDKA